MKRKKKKLVTKEINFLLLALAFILAVGIIATKKYNPTKQIVKVIDDVSEVDQKETLYAEVIDGIYYNYQYGFSFDYSSDFFSDYKDYQTRVMHEKPSNIVGFTKVVNENGSEIALNVSMTEDKEKIEEIESYIDKQNNTNLNFVDSSPGNYSKLRNLNVNGMPGLYYSYDSNNQTDEPTFADIVNLIVSEKTMYQFTVISRSNSVSVNTQRKEIINSLITSLEFSPSNK